MNTNFQKYYVTHKFKDKYFEQKVIKFVFKITGYFKDFDIRTWLNPFRRLLIAFQRVRDNYLKKEFPSERFYLQFVNY